MFRNRPSLNTRCQQFLALLLLSLCSGFSFALSTDSEQEIRVAADQLVRDDNKDITIFSGNARIEQGSILITADKITIFGSGEAADKIIAHGKLAHFQQQNDDSTMIYAEGEIIEYFKSEDRIHLQNNASVKQEGSVITGETINYFLAKKLVQANSANAQTNTGDTRVEVVIPAKKGSDSKE